MPKAKLNKIDLKPVAALLLSGETNQSARARKAAKVRNCLEEQLENSLKKSE